MMCFQTDNASRNKLKDKKIRSNIGERKYYVIIIV